MCAYESACVRIRVHARVHLYICACKSCDKHSIVCVVGNLAWASFQTVSFAIVANNGFFTIRYGLMIDYQFNYNTVRILTISI